MGLSSVVITQNLNPFHNDVLVKLSITDYLDYILLITINDALQIINRR